MKVAHFELRSLRSIAGEKTQCMQNLRELCFILWLCGCMRKGHSCLSCDGCATQLVGKILDLINRILIIMYNVIQILLAQEHEHT